MIEKNQTWELIDWPSHRKTTSIKWVFKTKLNNKLMAKLVAKGTVQCGFFRNFCTLIRMLLALATQNEWKIY